MDVKLFFPSPSLKPFIQCYEFFDAKSSTFGDESVLNLPSLDQYFLFFFFRGKPVFINNAEISNENLPACTLVQSFLLPTYNCGINDFDAFRIKFHPGVISTIFNFSFKGIRSNVLDLGDYLDKELHLLHEMFAENSCSNYRISIFEKYLMKKLRWYNATNEKTLFQALDEVFKVHRYSLKVKGIKDKIGFFNHEKVLNRRLEKMFGYTISKFREVHRFNQILEYIQNVPFKNLSEVAYQFGFEDLAHFNKRFKIMTNQNPKDFLKYTNRGQLLYPDSTNNIEQRGFIVPWVT